MKKGTNYRAESIRSFLHLLLLVGKRPLNHYRKPKQARHFDHREKSLILSKQDSSPQWGFGMTNA